MRRLFLILGLCVSLLPGRAAAAEQILHWLVDEDHTGVFSFDVAILYAQVGDGERLAISGTTLMPSGTYMETDLWAALQTEDLTGYRFFIELLNIEAGGLKGVAISQTSTYSDLASHHYLLGTGIADMTSHDVWTPYFMIPEPSSGLLLLLGSALLVLRRRRHA